MITHLILNKVRYVEIVLKSIVLILYYLKAFS